MTQSNSIILGAINGINGATADTKVGIGTTAPTSKLTVAGLIETTAGGVKFPDGTTQTTAAGGGGAGGILNQTSVQAGANFNIDGTGRADVLNAATQYNLGGQRIIGGSGQNNLFIGKFAGAVTPVLGGGNFENTFVGTSSGEHNVDCCNAFFGNYSGQNNTSGGGNTFLGYQAGKANTTGSNNTFVGLNSGNVFSTGNGNTFVGNGAGNVATSGGNNTMLGQAASFAFGSNNLSFAAAIGAGAQVSTSNTIVIGRPADTVNIAGTLTKAAGSFKIDHPLDPANKTLSHSFVESPDMMNIYNGNITTDSRGEAVVALPAYFEALNRDFRYQLTVIGQFAQAIVAEKVMGNQFKIKTDKPKVEVSWQITGIRHDKFADERRIPNEETKPDTERGKCLYAPNCKP